MIKENITAYINSYAHEGEIIIPSLVLTSTKQDETVNLSYTPNFQLRLEDSYGYINVSDTTYVTFAVESYNYTAYAKALVRDGSYVTLQYANGLSKSAQPAPEPPAPEPTVTYITFDAGTFSYYGSRNAYNGETVEIAGWGVDNDEVTFSDSFKTTLHPVITDNLGNNVTQYATISSNEFDMYNGINTESEGEEWFAWEWQHTIESTDDSTPVTAYITASYTVGGQTFTATNEYVCLVTSDGVAPEPEPEPEPAGSLHFSAPENGEYIEGIVDPESGEFECPIEVVYANDESVPYDITMLAVTSENYSIGSYEDEGGVSGVFVSLPVGEGTDTLTFTDPETEETCTTTFTYNIAEPEPEPEPEEEPTE